MAYNRRMDFSGWEKLSLVDFDDNLTTTFFMAGCDFRCPFCHNSDLVLRPKDAPRIPWNEMLDYLKKRTGVLDAVCVTGGEPTIMPDLLEKLKEIKALGYKIKLDSNGSHPEVLKKAIEEKLIDYVAMDIKNCKERYAETVGLEKLDLSPIEESVRYLQSTGFPHEFRTTIISEFHDDESIKKIGEWIKGAPRYFLQEYIDSENCIKHGYHPVEKEKAQEFLELLKNDLPNAKLRGYD